MHCYESVDGLPLAAVTVRRFKLLLKRIWVKVMFYNVLSHMHYFQASSVLHWFLVKCLIASWMQYNSVLSANMVYISKWYTALTGRIRSFVQIWEGSENWAPTGCTEGRRQGKAGSQRHLAETDGPGGCGGSWVCVGRSGLCLSPPLSADGQAEQGLVPLASPRSAGRSLSWPTSSRRLAGPTPTVTHSWIGSGVSLAMSKWLCRTGLSVV